MSLVAVPQPDDDAGQFPEQTTFEGLTVSRSRINPPPPGSFPCIDQDTQEGIELHHGQIVTIQYEVRIGVVSFDDGSGTKPKDRIHEGKLIKGSQAIVRVEDPS